MKNIPYQQNAVNELTDKTIRLLNLGGKRHKIVFEAPTGAGKTVMTCQALANINDELKEPIYYAPQMPQYLNNILSLPIDSNL